jgi:hypothetical protein
MAKIHQSHLSWASVSPCSSRITCRWRETFPVRSVSVSLLVTYHSLMKHQLLPLGGEFSSLHQNSFHHYRDFWCFDITTHSWDRIETKIRPSARSGHRLAPRTHSFSCPRSEFGIYRMAIWKHYVVLFGGFYDPGYISTANFFPSFFALD